MAVVLQATYSKKLGLPQFSSHQFTVSVQSELTDLSQVPEACGELHALLQDSVDREIRKVGWLPDSGGGPAGLNGEDARASNGSHPDATWKCSPKQRELILDIVDEHGLDRHAIDALARQRFDKGVKALNKLEASGLIDELLESNSKGNGRRRSFPRRPSGTRERRAS